MRCGFASQCVGELFFCFKSVLFFRFCGAVQLFKCAETTFAPHCIALDFIISLLSIKYVPVAGVAQGFTNKRDVQWQQVQTPSHFYFKTSNLL
jgi:hypothetical protein